MHAKSMHENRNIWYKVRNEDRNEFFSVNCAEKVMAHWMKQKEGLFIFNGLFLRFSSDLIREQ